MNSDDLPVDIPEIHFGILSNVRSSIEKAKAIAKINTAERLRSEIQTQQPRQIKDEWDHILNLPDLKSDLLDLKTVNQLSKL